MTFLLFSMTKWEQKEDYSSITIHSFPCCGFDKFMHNVLAVTCSQLNNKLVNIAKRKSINCHECFYIEYLHHVARQLLQTRMKFIFWPRNFGNINYNFVFVFGKNCPHEHDY
jgi:hypothetical protein